MSLNKSLVREIRNSSFDVFISNISSKLAQINSNDSLYRLNYMESGVKLKLFSMEYHLNNLINLFISENIGSTETQNKMRTEFDCFLYASKCVLDKLSQEAKILFEYDNIAEDKMNFYNVTQKKDLIGILSKRISELEWFSIFNAYRNTGTHRNIPILTFNLQLGSYDSPYKRVLEDSFSFIDETKFNDELSKIKNIFLRSDGSALSVLLRENPTDIHPGQVEKPKIELISFCILSNLIVLEFYAQAKIIFQTHIQKI